MECVEGIKKVRLSELERYTLYINELNELYDELTSTPHISGVPKANFVPPVCARCGSFMQQISEMLFECQVCKNRFSVSTSVCKSDVFKWEDESFSYRLSAIAPVIVSHGFIVQKFNIREYNIDKNVTVIGKEMAENIIGQQKAMERRIEIEEKIKELEKRIKAMEQEGRVPTWSPRATKVEFTLIIDSEHSMDEEPSEAKIVYYTGWEIKIHLKQKIDEWELKRVEKALKQFFGDYPITIIN